MHAQNPQGSNHQERVKTVTEDAKDEFVTQTETGEQAPVDEVEGRVEAEMKRIEGSAREAVGQGLQDERTERAGRELREEGERELDEQREQ
jgi:uncharacterized protein YjbJ (UPF0337 family)